MSKLQYLFKTNAYTKNANAVPIIPPIAPSIVFLGLIVGHNLCFPNLTPTKYAKASDKQAPNNINQIKYEPIPST